MSDKIVKVINVLQNHEQEKKDGGVYECTLLTYTDGGKPFSKPFHNKILENNKPLARALHSLQPGDSVKITQVKTESGFWNVTGLEKMTKEAVAKDKASVSNVRGSFADNAIGLQVGNALTNATTLLSNNSPEVKGMTLLEAARHIIKVGETLKRELAAGEHSKVEEKKEPEAKTPAKPAAKKKAPPKEVPPEEPEDDLEDVPEDEEIDY